MEDFDKDFKLMTRMIIGCWIGIGMVSLLSLGFSIFVVVKLMQYFGVL